MVLLHYEPPTDPYLSIVYRDDDIIVLDKPSGLLSVQGRAAAHFDSIQTRVQRVFPTASVVHRLDMATSGLLVMALNKPANSHLSRQFQQRKVSKTYYARVYGQVTPAQGKVELPLICDWPNRPKQMVDHEHGKPSVTEYTVEQQDAFSALVRLNPITGRSHQLRVHMQALGYPILGDRLYAEGEALRVSPRLLLHATTLEFDHPTQPKRMQFRSEHPFSCEPTPDSYYQHQGFIRVDQNAEIATSADNKTST
nr:RluA family pseudouridine synthase [Alteromonas flava]